MIDACVYNVLISDISRVPLVVIAGEKIFHKEQCETSPGQS